VSERGRHLIAVCIAYLGVMLWSPAYLESRLPRPLPTKDGGTLYAVKDVMGVIPHIQERMPHGLFAPDEAVSASPWPFTKIQSSGTAGCMSGFQSS